MPHSVGNVCSPGFYLVSTRRACESIRDCCTIPARPVLCARRRRLAAHAPHGRSVSVRRIRGARPNSVVHCGGYCSTDSRALPTGRVHSAARAILVVRAPFFPCGSAHRPGGEAAPSLHETARSVRPHRPRETGISTAFDAFTFSSALATRGRALCKVSRANRRRASSSCKGGGDEVVSQVSGVPDSGGGVRGRNGCVQRHEFGQRFAGGKFGQQFE
jgi:hypothetical protein